MLNISIPVKSLVKMSILKQGRHLIQFNWGSLYSFKTLLVYRMRISSWIFSWWNDHLWCADHSFASKCPPPDCKDPLKRRFHMCPLWGKGIVWECFSHDKEQTEIWGNPEKREHYSEFVLLGNCLNSHRELRKIWSHHPQSFIDTPLYTHGTFEALIERRKCPPTPWNWNNQRWIIPSFEKR